jgi:hypothetical protein
VKILYPWTRDLHLYLGLWVSPFVLVFAASVILLNHPSIPLGRAPSVARTAAVQFPPALLTATGAARLASVRDIMRQSGVNGEIGNLWDERDEKRFKIVVWQPGREIAMFAYLDGRVEITQRNTGLLDAINYLHKSPGPHMAAIRGNWLPTRVWGWLADATVYLLLFISGSGVYLWAVLRAERRTGLILLAAGALSFTGIVYALAG